MPTLQILDETTGMVKVDDGHYEFWLPKSEFLERTAVKQKVTIPRSRKMNSKMLAVLQFMLDGQWRSLRQISEGTAYPSLTGLSACIRSLRKPEYGSHMIEKRFVTESLYEYRLIQ
jgi:hypothetical protein